MRLASYVNIRLNLPTLIENSFSWFKFVLMQYIIHDNAFARYQTMVEHPATMTANTKHNFPTLPMLTKSWFRPTMRATVFSVRKSVADGRNTVADVHVCIQARKIGDSRDFDIESCMCASRLTWHSASSILLTCKFGAQIECYVSSQITNREGLWVIRFQCTIFRKD